MTDDEWRLLWESLDEDQRESVRMKARWEQMPLRAVCEEWPGVWSDPERLAFIRSGREQP